MEVEVVMSFTGKLVTLFPGLVLVLLLFQIVNLILNPIAINFISIPLIIYFFPLLTFRLLSLMSPLEEGESDLFNGKYSNWWASHQFQICLLYTSPSPRDQRGSRMPSSA